jgi:hypothetical protein
MPNPGSYTFFGNLVVNWSYDAPKGQLTVSATLNGRDIGSKVLSSGTTTGQISGSEGGQSAVVGLTANFSTMALDMAAQETNPTRTGTHSSDF